MESAVNPGKLHGAGSMSPTLKVGRTWARVGEGERQQARAWWRDSCALGQWGGVGRFVGHGPTIA